MKTLVFSIALNGYAYGFKRALASHYEYSKKIGAEYFVAKKLKVEDPALAAWMKVSLIHKALEEGCEYVAYIDADCFIKPSTPDFRENFAGSVESILMARGISGRWNSGIIFVKNTHEARQWFQAMIDSITEPIEESQRRNLRFENGNIIAVEAKLGGVTEIDYRWNNSYRQDGQDYIRHYTGEFKQDYHRSFVEDYIFKFLKFISPRATAAPESRSEDFRKSLFIATDKVWSSER